MSRRRPVHRVRPGAYAAGWLVAVVMLAGCTPEPGPTSAPTSAAPTATSTPTPSPTSTPTPTGPILHPEGTAADNLPLFTAVTKRVWGSSGKAKGRAYVDALVAAGFAKAHMQVTEDRSTVGNAAESLQFSVLWGDECLIGQVGPATGNPVTSVMPALAGGTCLVGATRPIDW